MDTKQQSDSEDKESIPFQDLLDALLDENSHLPAKILYRLSDLGESETSELSGIWNKISLKRRTRLMEDLEQLEESNTIVSFDAVCKIAFKDEQAEVRQIAIRTLWNYDDPKLINTLIEFITQDKSQDVRAQAAMGLGHFVLLGEVGNIRAEKLEIVVDTLLELLRSDQPEIVKQRALESLGYSGRESVRDQIEKSFVEGDENWVTSALFAMGRSADSNWTPEVLDKLDDANPKIRQEAIRAAGALGIEEALPALLYLLESEDSEIILAAAWALSEIGGDEVREALEELVSTLDDEDEADFIEDALENLELTEEIGSFNIFDIPEEDFEQLEEENPKKDI